jgi:hypothetical protein
MANYKTIFISEVKLQIHLITNFILILSNEYIIFQKNMHIIYRT